MQTLVYTHKITGCHNLENYILVNYTSGGFVGFVYEPEQSWKFANKFCALDKI